MSRVVLTLLAILIAVTLDVEIAAQTLDQDHGQYSRADVEAGQRLYGPQCQVCHGANGDGVPGIDLRLGRFRRASSDDDLARVITSGIPGTGMPAFKLQPAELTGSRRLHPRRLRSRVGVGARRQRRARPRAVRRQGRLRARATGSRATGRALAPDLSDIGAIRTLAALQRSLLEPDRVAAADQPARAHRHEGRPHDPRPAPERRHLHRAADRRPGAPALAGQGGPASELVVETDGDDAVVPGPADAPTRWPTSSPISRR